LMAIQFMDPMDIQTLKIHHQDHQDWNH
jgi:hypothetical protein